MSNVKHPIAPLPLNPKLAKALSMAKNGIPVFPLIPNDKKPLTKHGFKDATTDPEQIKAWWAETPDANIGMPTGKASGIFVLDIDPRHGGDASLQAIIAQYGTLPETQRVRTGGGGEHIYLANPDIQIRNSAGKLGAGLDIRCEGGYVVVPPSVTEREYVDIEPELPIAEAPQWLFALMDKAARPEVSKADWQELEISEGGRNDKLTSLAGVLRHKGLGQEAILDTLRSINRHHTDNPLPDDEVVRIARNMANYEPKPNQHDETDVGNALLLQAMFGGSMLYCHAMKRWLFWQGKYWQEDSTGEAERKCMEMVNVHASSFGKGHLKRAKSPAGMAAMLSIARHLPSMYVTMPELDANPWLLNLNNGTLDLHTRTLRSHSPADLMTKILPIDYLPDATAPRFQQFMYEVMLDNQEMISFMQRFMGYCLTGEIKESKFFTFHGDGANGKSTLISVIHDVLGHYAVAAQGSTFLHRRSERIRNDIAALAGARFVSAVEVDPDDRLDEVLLKQITGGDTISVRKLYSEPFEMLPTFKLVLGVNRLPAIVGTDRGIWRRVCVIPFSATFEGDKQDKDLITKLRSERSGILNWMLVGLSDWKQQGLSEPVPVVQASQNYRARMDTLGLFINEECEQGDALMVRTSNFNAAYDRWCKDYGYFAISRRDLVPTMESKRFQREKRRGGYLHYVGLALKEELDREY